MVTLFRTIITMKARGLLCLYYCICLKNNPKQRKIIQGLTKLTAEKKSILIKLISLLIKSFFSVNVGRKHWICSLK